MKGGVDQDPPQGGVRLFSQEFWSGNLWLGFLDFGLGVTGNIEDSCVDIMSLILILVA